jgi:hypothetical protein
MSWHRASGSEKLNSRHLWYTTAKQDPALYYLYSMTRLKQGKGKGVPFPVKGEWLVQV